MTLDFSIVAISACSADILNKSTDPVNLYGELARTHSTVLFTGLDNSLGKMEIRKI